MSGCALRRRCVGFGSEFKWLGWHGMGWFGLVWDVGVLVVCIIHRMEGVS